MIGAVQIQRIQVHGEADDLDNALNSFLFELQVGPKEFLKDFGCLIGDIMGPLGGVIPSPEASGHLHQ